MRDARSLWSHFLLIIAVFILLPGHANAQADLSPELRSKIDKLANDALAESGVPSASIAVVRDGKIVYLNAYGSARLEPKTPATTAMRAGKAFSR
jgi:CubicO group peptidase (beta-lactamase class C family)